LELSWTFNNCFQNSKSLLYYLLTSTCWHFVFSKFVEQLELVLFIEIGVYVLEKGIQEDGISGISFSPSIFGVC
jgi:hypothetical protein